MDISIPTILIWITAIIIISLDLVIVIGSRNLSSRVFAALSFTTAIWVISSGFFISTLSSNVSNILIRFQYVLGISIALGFYLFSLIYPNDKKITKKHIYVPILIIIIFAYLFLFSNHLIIYTFYIGGINKWGWNFGNFQWLFEFAFCGLWTFALLNLYRTYKNSSGPLRINLKNMFWALFLGIIPPTIVNILLPAIGYFRLNWFGPVTSAIWILIIAYSIIRYRQMSVRIVVTEALAVAMTAIFFINIFIDFAPNIYIRIVTFTAFIILAYFLIRGALLESRQKEQLADLNQNLEAKVAEQTAEIRRAYEVEKKARVDLEKLNDSKNQFIMITQHHLRTPVTSISWQLESMISGEYGTLSPELHTAVLETEESTKRLTHIIDDFLDIAAMKAGSNILNFTERSLLSAMQEVLHDLRTDIARKHISVTYPETNDDWPKLHVDYEKMRDILLIVIENAVRYNYEAGSITITTRTHSHKFEIFIKNTGIGITPEESEKIGSTLFYRGMEARKQNAIGMGVGLSVSKAIIRGHQGSFDIESKGPGMGATVTITLPLKQN